MSPKLPLTSPPESLCLLRLSAVGDIAHALPLVRTLQKAWPQTRITWVIGRLEYSLVGDIPGIEFIIFDKSRRWRAFTDLRRALKGRRFDVLLHMQMSLRASLASLLVRAKVRLGFDRGRAKDGQWLFTNAQIAPGGHEHVLESFLGFAHALGIEESELRWDIPIPYPALQFAAETLPPGPQTLIISPCSSMAYRDWNAEGYAQVAAHAIERHGMRVLLTGGKSRREWLMGAQINAALERLGHAGEAENLIGKTDLKQLLALLEAADVLLAPDSGPAHLATAVGTPVIGLYACTNPDRARPYLSERWLVNRYPEAVAAKYEQPIDELPWGIRVKDAGTMERIEPEAVCATLDRLIQENS